LQEMSNCSWFFKTKSYSYIHAQETYSCQS